MTLPSRRKHPTTAPNTRKGREGTSFPWDKQPCLSFFSSTFQWAARALAAGSISAAVTLSGFAAEPDDFTADDEASAAPSQEQPLAQARILRWKTSRISRGSEGASNLHSRSATTIIAAGHEESLEG